MKEWSSIGELFDHHRFQEYSKQEIYQVLLHSSGRREGIRLRRFEIGCLVTTGTKMTKMFLLMLSFV